MVLILVGDLSTTEAHSVIILAYARTYVCLLQPGSLNMYITEYVRIIVLELFTILAI